MDPLLLIPKDKGDTETAAQLQHYTYEQLKPIIPALLEWLQDGNWPVARPVSEYLESISNDITVEIMDAFRTGDLIWNYWLMLTFGPATTDHVFRTEIRRIASYPTQQEKEELLYEVAKDIVEEWNT